MSLKHLLLFFVMALASLGVTAQVNGTVLDENNEPVPGLYVLGNTMAGRYGVDYPMLLPGNSTGTGLTYGYLLGRAFGAQE